MKTQTYKSKINNETLKNDNNPKIRIEIGDQSVNENELVWSVSAIILGEMLKTRETKKKEVNTKNPVKNYTND